MRLRAAVQGDRIEVKILVAHPEETGFRKRADGTAIPAHYITNLSASYGGREVFHAQCGPAISSNPFLHFAFHGAPGEELTVTWLDNQGNRRIDCIAIPSKDRRERG
jgi:sulfur-oxidizing protein SoxZ